MENHSNKSERNLSVKYKNTLSYKSVSEVSEFEEPYEEENSDYMNRNNNEKNKGPKSNESIHSIVSNFYKDIFEDKDDENENENDNNDNRQFSRTSRSFTPLLGITTSFKNGISTNIRTNITHTLDEVANGLTYISDNSILASITYNFSKGIRFSLPFTERNVYLKNNMNITLNFK